MLTIYTVLQYNVFEKNKVIKVTTTKTNRMKSKIILIISLSFICSNFLLAGGIQFEKLTLKEALDKASKEDKNIFIDIYATWCGPCKYLSREVFTDEELGNFMNENYINIKLDGELPDGESLMVDFDLNSYPTMLFLSTDKTLLKKIVGAVSPDEILRKGKDVLYPEKTEIFKLTKKYNEGIRDRDFLKTYVRVLMEEDKESEAVATEFIQLFPDVDLKNEDEFLIFCLSEEDQESEISQEFIDNIEEYHQLHQHMAESKLKYLLVDLALRAKAENDPTIIHLGVDRLFEPFCKVFGDDFEKDDVTSRLLEIMDEE